MTPLTRLIPLIVLLATARGDSGCVAVEGAHIRLADIAAAVPAFAAANGETQVAPAPLPGARRVLSPVELAAIARRNGIELSAPAEACFEYIMEPLDPGKVVEAMRNSLEDPDMGIEIVETSLTPVPRGVVQFPRDRLVAPATGHAPALWRGDVVYAAGRRFAVWARVLLHSRQTRVVAATSLRAGQPIGPDQIRIESTDGFPLSQAVARSLDQVAGRVPLRPIMAGREIRLDQVAPPPDVRRGETVEVEVCVGRARLALSGKAESDGRRGELISVRNLANQRSFQARVSGKRKVEIVAGAVEAN